MTNPAEKTTAERNGICRTEAEIRAFIMMKIENRKYVIKTAKDTDANLTRAKVELAQLQSVIDYMDGV